MRPEQLRRRVADARHGYLGTAGPEGRPHLVPFCFVLDRDRVYSAVDSKPKRTGKLQRLENIRRQPLVSVLVDHYEEDWQQLWWVRMDGLGEVLPPGAETDHAVQLLSAKYPQYARQPPPGPVIKVTIHHWTAWSAESLPLP